MKSLLLSIACAVALAACSKSKQPDPPPPPPPEKTVFDTQLKALQKAKDVQNVVDDQKKKADKQLEDNGG